MENGEEEERRIDHGLLRCDELKERNATPKPLVAAEADVFFPPRKFSSWKSEKQLPAETDVEIQHAFRILNELMSDANKSVNQSFMNSIETNYEVDKKDYYQVIRNPIWLLKIKEKFYCKKYQSITQFVADMRLMLENCYRYFGPNNPTTKKGVKLEMMMEQKLALLPRELREKTTLEATSGKSNEEWGGTRRKSSRLSAGENSLILNHVCHEKAERDRQLRRKQMEERKAEKEEKEKEIIKWEEELRQDPIGTQLRASWELPQIGHFLFLCQSQLNIPEVPQYELERILLLPRESVLLSRIMTSLLSSPNQRSHLDRIPSMPYRIWTEKLTSRVAAWYKTLQAKEFKPELVFDVLGIEPPFFQILGKTNPLDNKAFHELTFHQRIWLLKSLCDYILHNHKTIQEAISEQLIADQRDYFLGEDSSSNRYLHFPQFCGQDLRIYRQAKWPSEKQVEPKSNPENLNQNLNKCRKTRRKSSSSNSVGTRSSTRCNLEVDNGTDQNEVKESNPEETSNLTLLDNDSKCELDVNEFELVVDSVESLRELITKIEEEQKPQKKTRKAKVNKCNAEEEEVNLLESLRNLLTELEPWEVKLQQATRRLRNKLRKEWNDFQIKLAKEEEIDNVWSSDEEVEDETKENDQKSDDFSNSSSDESESASSTSTDFEESTDVAYTSKRTINYNRKRKLEEIPSTSEDSSEYSTTSDQSEVKRLRSRSKAGESSSNVNAKAKRLESKLPNGAAKGLLLSHSQQNTTTQAKQLFAWETLRQILVSPQKNQTVNKNMQESVTENKCKKSDIYAKQNLFSCRKTSELTNSFTSLTQSQAVINKSELIKSANFLNTRNNVMPEKTKLRTSEIVNIGKLDKQIASGKIVQKSTPIYPKMSSPRTLEGKPIYSPETSTVLTNIYKSNSVSTNSTLSNISKMNYSEIKEGKDEKPGFPTEIQFDKSAKSTSVITNVGFLKEIDKKVIEAPPIQGLGNLPGAISNSNVLNLQLQVKPHMSDSKVEGLTNRMPSSSNQAEQAFILIPAVDQKGNTVYLRVVSANKTTAASINSKSNTELLQKDQTKMLPDRKQLITLSKTSVLPILARNSLDSAPAEKVPSETELTNTHIILKQDINQSGVNIQSSVQTFQQSSSVRVVSQGSLTTTVVPNKGGIIKDKQISGNTVVDEKLLVNIIDNKLLPVATTKSALSQFPEQLQIENKSTEQCSVTASVIPSPLLAPIQSRPKSDICNSPLSFNKLNNISQSLDKSKTNSSLLKQILHPTSPLQSNIKLQLKPTQLSNSNIQCSSVNVPLQNKKQTLPMNNTNLFLQIGPNSIPYKVIPAQNINSVIHKSRSHTAKNPNSTHVQGNLQPPVLPNSQIVIKPGLQNPLQSQISQSSNASISQTLTASNFVQLGLISTSPKTVVHPTTVLEKVQVCAQVTSNTSSVDRSSSFHCSSPKKQAVKNINKLQLISSPKKNKTTIQESVNNIGTANIPLNTYVPLMKQQIPIDNHFGVNSSSVVTHANPELHFASLPVKMLVSPNSHLKTLSGGTNKPVLSGLPTSPITNLNPSVSSVFQGSPQTVCFPNKLLNPISSTVVNNSAINVTSAVSLNSIVAPTITCATSNRPSPTSGQVPSGPTQIQSKAVLLQNGQGQILGIVLENGKILPVNIAVSGSNQTGKTLDEPSFDSRTVTTDVHSSPAISNISVTSVPSETH